jgi:hypothetical protein
MRRIGHYIFKNKIRNFLKMKNFWVLTATRTILLIKNRKRKRNWKRNWKRRT